MPYSPFDKHIGQRLQATDLDLLKTRLVAEGYFVEYKETFPGNDKIGHSLASFANTFGGWYIVGVKTDAHNVADDICGYDLGLHPDAAARVRDVARTHIDPVPVLYPQVVELGGGRAVLAVYVPDRQETPFITTDGRIYRRTHDSSNPIPENSRHALDRLVDAGNDLRRQWEAFCRDDRQFSRAEEKQGWLCVYLSPYPWGVVQKSSLYRDETADSLLERSRINLPVHLAEGTTVNAGLPFNTAQLTGQGVILQQVNQGAGAFNSLTLELYSDARARMFIPLLYVRALTEEYMEQVTTPGVEAVLRELEEKDGYELLKFFDIGRLWLATMSLSTFYLDWLGSHEIVHEMRAVVSTHDAWRSVPFYDHEQWAKHVRRRGLPVMMHDSVTIPNPIGGGRSISLDNRQSFVPMVCGLIGAVFGLPPEVVGMGFGHAVASAVRTSQNAD